ncbi:MAG: 50S ribosomal protein L21 [Armatimonadota bacterium]
MYAIVQAGGRQYKVTQNDVISLNRLAVPEGEEVVLDRVLLIADKDGTKVGTPYVPGAKVVGQVLRHYKGRKIRGFTYKPKKDERRRYGHRQLLTSVAIKEIQV